MDCLERLNLGVLFVIGRWRGRYVHIPMALAVSRRNQVCPDGDLWLSVFEATGQPLTFA